MPPPPNKDYYSILGVEPEVSMENLRDAYLFLTRAIHPDRFDPQTQAKDWRQANARMIDINEAYAVLRDPEKRKSYDDLRLGRARPPSTGQARATSHGRTSATGDGGSRPPPGHLERFSSGRCIYWDLPAAVRERLLRRQDGLDPDQAQVRVKLIGWNYLYLIFLCGWFAMLFMAAFGPLWSERLLFVSGGISLIAGILISGNLVTLLRWHKSVLKPFFYLTPIYFIKTAYDNVSFHSLWTLKDYSVTHHYFAGIYHGTSVLLAFDDFEEILKFKSPAEWEEFDQRLYVYREMLRIELLNNNDVFFLKNDDFHGVNRSSGKRHLQLKRSKRFAIYVTTTACFMALWAAFAIVNKAANRESESDLPPAAFGDEP